MTDTTIATANRVKQWDADFFSEYVRQNRFRRYMGTSSNDIIVLNENLTKKKGDAITIPLVGAIDPSAGANDGSTDLVGNEKALPNAGHQINIGVVRDAVVVNMEEEQASPIDIRNAAKSSLKRLAMQYMRTDIITALHSIQGVAYGSASEAQKDAWLASNDDRVLFGAAKANNAANDHSASLLNVDATNDVLSPGIISLAKRMAGAPTDPASSPSIVEEDTEGYVMFIPSPAFRDLQNDSTMTQANREARARGITNPLFRGGDLIWDNVVCREIPEIDTLTGVGAASIDVAPCFLCKSQSLGVGWAMRTKTTTRNEDDYGFKNGVGFMELRGVEKLQYFDGSDYFDWGVTTVYVAGVADA